MSPDGRFASKYPVAIEFIDGFEAFDKHGLLPEQQTELVAGLTLHLLIDTDDAVQFSLASGHIYTYDFSESFFNQDDLILKAYSFNQNFGDQLLGEKMGAFNRHLAGLSFASTSLAAEFGLDPSFMETEMLKTAKKVAEISDDEILSVCSELERIFPVEISVYYEDCIRGMQQKMSKM